MWITTNARLASIRDEVRTFCRRFPVPGITPV
jgi:hypothetical protein